jgi:hypothetical protein
MSFLKQHSHDPAVGSKDGCPVQTFGRIARKQIALDAARTLMDFGHLKLDETEIAASRRGTVDGRTGIKSYGRQI